MAEKRRRGGRGLVVREAAPGSDAVDRSFVEGGGAKMQNSEKMMSV